MIWTAAACPAAPAEPCARTVKTTSSRVLTAALEPLRGRSECPQMRTCCTTVSFLQAHHHGSPPPAQTHTVCSFAGLAAVGSIVSALVTASPCWCPRTDGCSIPMPACCSLRCSPSASWLSSCLPSRMSSTSAPSVANASALAVQRAGASDASRGLWDCDEGLGCDATCKCRDARFSCDCLPRIHFNCIERGRQM